MADFKIISWLLVCLWVCGFSSKAESLDATALEILKHSPEYQYGNLKLTSVEKENATLSNLPDPELGGEYLVAPVSEDNRWALELSWGLEWPGVYNARSKEARLKTSVFEKELQAHRAEKLAEIKDLLLDYIRTCRKLSLLDELSQNNDTIYRLAVEATKGGEMTVLDLNKIKLEYANIRVAKATVLDEQADIITSLSSIYGEDCHSLLKKMDPQFPVVEPPSKDVIEAIKKSAPAVEAAKAEAEAAKLGKKVAKMEALPSISFGYKHAYEEGTHFNGATLGISIPVFSSKGKQKALDAEISAAEFKADATSQEIETETLALIRRLELITSQINEIAPIIENTDYNATLLKAYKGGQLTLIEYIADRNYFTNAAVELVTLRHNAAKTMALLQRYASTLSGSGLIL